jgi:hypothetical protein
LMYLMCIPKCILDSFGIRVKYMQNIKIHVFSWNVTEHVRYILRYIRIHKGYMYPSEYMQDTCRIHQNTSGYVSDRNPPPKRIGNPTSPQRTSRLRVETPARALGLRAGPPKVCAWQIDPRVARAEQESEKARVLFTVLRVTPA